MNGFEKRSSEIKRRIQKTTLELLATTSPDSIKIADLAQKADVSPVTIYNYFGNKKKLIKETLQTWYLQQVREIEEFIGSEDKSLKETLRFIIFNEKKSVQEFSAERLNELLSKDPEMNFFVEKVYRERITPVLVQMIEKAKRQGEIQHDLPHSLIIFYVNLFTSQLETILEQADFYQSQESFVEDVVHLFFYGIAGRKNFSE